MTPTLNLRVRLAQIPDNVSAEEAHASNETIPLVLCEGPLPKPFAKCRDYLSLVLTAKHFNIPLWLERSIVYANFSIKDANDAERFFQLAGR